MQKIVLLLLLVLNYELLADRGLKLIKEMREEQRVALVIGNNNYQNLSVLKNPINDARSIKNELQKRGFEVLYKENATKRDMQKLIKSFTNKLTSGGVGLYYFAGHGINVEGQNYLVSIDSNMDSKEDVEYESYALNRITKKIQNAHNRLNIVILDACRNDPFSRGGSGGLAPIGDAKGIFVAYATQAGNVASDGGSGHGVFTKHLIQYMSEEGAPIEKVFKNVRRSVQNDTSGKQSPGVYNQIVGEFYFTLPVYDTKTTQNKSISSFSFSDDAPIKYSLTINTTPKKAKIKITNIKPKYYKGINLEAGNYTIKVSNEGYYSKTGTVDLKNDLSVDVVLKKLEEKIIKQQHQARKSYEPEMVHISRGTFTMGSNEGQKDEKPLHQVSIGKDFLLGKYEVTVGQYNVCVNDRGCDEPKKDKYYYEMCLEDNCPIMKVSWNNAKQYAKWISRKTGKHYRLPSESEWEYAARAGSSTKYHFSNSDANLAQYAWYSKNSGQRTHKVGQKMPNAFGLYDMHGNVWEWCEDWYADSYNNTPRNERANAKGAKTYKVLRGGSWINTSNFFRSAFRIRNNPINRNYNNGFRLAGTLP